MKKIIIFCLLIVTVFIAVAKAYAVSLTPTPSVTPSPTPNDLLNQQEINALQQKIASRVAQLNLVEKKGIIANVTDVNETQITLSDLLGNTRFVDVDELTKFSSPSASSGFGISDITKGSTVSVLGLYNKETRRILARFVNVITLQQVINGAVTKIDNQNFEITVATANQKNIIARVEDITRTYSYTNPTDGLIKSGFSKIQQAERILVTGYTDIADKNKIIASRIIIFPNLPPNPRIALIKPQDMQIIPATGSGKKLVPIIRSQ